MMKENINNIFSPFCLNDEEYEKLTISPKDLKKEYEVISDISTVQSKNDILDKIRTEVANIEVCGQVDQRAMFVRDGEQVKNMVIAIIDKYRQEE